MESICKATNFLYTQLNNNFKRKIFVGENFGREKKRKKDKRRRKERIFVGEGEDMIIGKKEKEK